MSNAGTDGAYPSSALVGKETDLCDPGLVGGWGEGALSKLTTKCRLLMLGESISKWPSKYPEDGNEQVVIP